MNQRHYLLKGTFVLTLTGLLTRAAGFFYKIFLSRAIGAEEIGRFQLTLPVFAFCTALTGGGIQTAVSRFTAEYHARQEERAALRILFCALLLSCSLSLGCAAALFFGADWIAGSFLLEPSCAFLLRITAVSLPFSAVHGCVSGFFIGRRNVKVSAISQLTEQLLRIAAVFFFYVIFQKGGRPLNASIMALGQVAGELAAALFCFYHLVFGLEKESEKESAKGLTKESAQEPAQEPTSVGTAVQHASGHVLGSTRHALRPTRSTQSTCRATHPTSRAQHSPHCALRPTRRDFRKTVSVSLPLSLNRMLLCVLQGIEAALLPQMLRRFGFSGSEALAVYGILTGMALPLILFPTAVTGALGTLLLPAVSEAHALKQNKKIADTIRVSFQGSLLLGLFFLTALLLFGAETGELLFHNALAGAFTRRLALLCPFLYMNTTLVSILHGLGKTTLVSVWNTIGFLIRLAAILLLVPGTGIDGYFTGLLCAQAFVSLCSLFALHKSSDFHPNLMASIVLPGLVCLASAAAMTGLRTALPALRGLSWGRLLSNALGYLALFALLAFWLLPDQGIKRELCIFLRKKAAG